MSLLLVSSNKEIPDFQATANLCDTFSKIIPGVSCNLTKLKMNQRLLKNNCNKLHKIQKIWATTSIVNIYIKQNTLCKNYLGF